MLPSSPADVHPWPFATTGPADDRLLDAAGWLVVLIGVTVVTVLAQPAQTTAARHTRSHLIMSEYSTE
jgi:hypothetical protein